MVIPLLSLLLLLLLLLLSLYIVRILKAKVKQGGGYHLLLSRKLLGMLSCDTAFRRLNTPVKSLPQFNATF